ncbi:MAG: TrmH family RNA methyltransferase, partial [Candidatus Micrarchaeota archaeon]
LAKKIRGRGKVALVFGSEGTGLKEEDICACDLIATIPSSAGQPVLNLSHAVAVLLYELYSSQEDGKVFFETAAGRKLKRLEQMFGEALAAANKAAAGRRVYDERKVATAFRRALERSELADAEAQALFAGLSRIRFACAASTRRTSSRN